MVLFYLSTYCLTYLPIYLPACIAYLSTLPTYLHCLPVCIAYLSASPTYLHCLPVCIAYLFAPAYPSASPYLCLPICGTLIRSIDRIVYSVRWLVVVVWLLRRLSGSGNGRLVLATVVWF